MAEHKKFRVFKCSIPACNVHATDGTTIKFVNNRLVTDEESVIEFMEAQIKAKHPHFYIDPKDSETDAEQEDPIAALRKKIIEEHEASKAGIVKDLGTSDLTGGEGTGATVSATAGLAAKLSNSIKK